MDKVTYRPGWRKSKMHECRSWDCCAQGKLVLTREERDALFSYIDQLEAVAHRAVDLAERATKG